MSGLLSRIFGSKKKEAKGNTTVDYVVDLLQDLVTNANFDLSFAVDQDAATNEIRVEFSGVDEGLLRARDGQLLDAIQLFVKRVVQHQLADEKIEISLDVGGYREETNQALIDLADKLREIVLSKGKSVYFRALPPKDRKVIHQYLSDDTRIRSRSVGDGHYKKIKIYPVKAPVGNTDNDVARAE